MILAALWRPFARALRGVTDSIRGPEPTRYSPEELRLSRMLALTPQVLRDSAYRQRRYRPWRVPKRDGSLRRLDVPDEALKATQRALLHHYLEHLPVHPAATGFRAGHSIATHARAHLGQAVVIAADITDFFGQTGEQRVRDFFAAQDWEEERTVMLLTRLCVWRGALPQGAPTSPALSNLVNRTLDEDLARWVQQRGGRYTRYGDDLAFSWPAEPLPDGLEQWVRRCLRAAGYQLNAGKGWRVWRTRRGEIPCLTGVLLGADGELHPQPSLHTALKQVRAAHDPISAQRQRGYEGFLKMLKR